MDSAASAEDGGGPRKSIELYYDQLDVGQAVAAAARVVENRTANQTEVTEAGAIPLDAVQTALKPPGQKEPEEDATAPVSSSTEADTKLAVVGQTVEESPAAEVPKVADSNLVAAGNTSEEIPAPAVLPGASAGDVVREQKVQNETKEVRAPPPSGMLEWSLPDATAPPDEPMLWSNLRFFEVAMDDNRRWVLRSQKGELEIALLAITAVRLDRRDPGERIFSVRHRASSGDRVECLFRAPEPTACSEWTRGLMGLITELRRGSADVTDRLLPRLKSAAQAVRAAQRLQRVMKP